jgi:hypothetical protein
MNFLSVVLENKSEILFKETVTYDLLIALITGVLSCLIFFGILRVFKQKKKPVMLFAKM